MSQVTILINLLWDSHVYLQENPEADLRSFL